MKFYETHFEDYLESSKKANLHPKLDNVYDNFPENIKDLKDIIFYGPKGVGKYTQLLKAISKYSPSNMKYEKKVIHSTTKSTHIMKISDIHFEVDMSLLGCNSKTLWNDIYNHIIDVISAKSDRTGIIVCKYFHDIHSELLDSFYSYMQTSPYNQLDIKFIFISEQISFIPDNIRNRCRIIRVPRPTRRQYNKCLDKKIHKDIKLYHITNMKNINASVIQLMYPYKIICDILIDKILNIDNLNYMELRDKLYELFIYNIDVTESIWYILEKLLEDIPEAELSNIIQRTYKCLHLFNNNYRPIYHLENYVFYLITKIHGLSESV
jgi:hypothetical protein